jgi:hypothetical protein
LIEAKFWAGLTEAQPVDYLTCLSEQGGKALFFLVPRERVGSISSKIVEIALAAGVPVALESTKDGVRVGATPLGPRLIVFSWERVLSALAAACGQDEDLSAVANVHQLAGLVQRFVSEGFGSMSVSELTGLCVPRQVNAVASLAERIIAEGSGSDKVILHSHPSHWFNFSGKSLNLRHENAWFGIHYTAWAKYHMHWRALEDLKLWPSDS